MDGLLNPLFEIESFNNLISYLKNNRDTVLATNVIDSQKIHLSFGVQNTLKKQAVYITYSELKAKEIVEDLNFFLGENIKFYPSKDIIFYSADVKSVEIVQKRLEILESLINGEKISIVLSIEALFDKISSLSRLSDSVLFLEVAKTISQEKLINYLIYLGYERTELVEGYGQFAVRGGIVDIFPINMKNAVRIEFWGDEIDSIRLLDNLSQRSIEKLESTVIFPMREFIFNENELDIAIKNVRSELEKTASGYQKKGLKEENENIKKNINEILEKMQNLKNFSGIENYADFFEFEKFSLIDFLNKDCLVFIDEPARISTHSENVHYEFQESIKNRILKGYSLPSASNMVYSYADIIHKLNKFQKVLLMSLTKTVKDFRIQEIANFMVKSSFVLQDRVDLLIEDLKFYCENNYRILILTGSSVRGERLLKELSENNISAAISNSLVNTKLEESIVTIARGSMLKGFEYPEIKFVVITDKEIFVKDKKSTKKKKKGAKIESFTDLRIGDYIVHDRYGIGIYKGIEKIITDNISRDYLKLEYQDGGALYVSTSQMDMIQKYIGGEGAHIKLNKLGGTEWNKAKARAKGQVQIMASELVSLYAKRLSNKGYIFSNDSVWQKEFEDLFQFEETDDQLNAIEDVKKDMESPKVMDRLICGDVGYGKTEVAIRAAFKCIQDGKQVAYLVPTTILAQQHYNTFVQRMSSFPVNVDMLSRFRTPKQQRLTIDGISKGKVDIIIGTHRILSKDIKFNNLGLIIVDEEQRFGVAQKEKLKAMKENVDVMALSATPIPRTLHMSLTGIRDISVLEEPPHERQPIQTYVLEYNDEFVKDAISRELARGGQVFYLHNRVKNISEVAARVQKLVPEANISYAHGQMSERELENIMLDFIEGEIDVLVCTTIIETGLDISNANTIIIQDADNMGLAQLYQLRGRVGRSTRIAYAYLMYRKDKVLNEISEKRLQTIKEFTEFGSGFKIAMRDLEIRGAGNLLGAEQHGYMDAVGYDMYCKLLDEEIRRLKGEIISEEFETLIDININAYIPSNYIKSEEQKLEIYKKISLIKDENDYFEVQEEIEDRYGDLLPQVQNLLDIAILKSVSHDKGAVSLIQKNSSVVVTFKPDADIKPESLTSSITKYSKKLKFSSQINPYLTYLSDDEKSINIKELKQILAELT